MRISFFGFFILLLLQGCSSSEPRRVEVLFLGHDRTHHNSEKYLPVLAAALANKGINFTYTVELQDLNENYLANFDALMLYANYNSISIEQESALMNYVNQGGGFLPIHCASWCFRNSDDYVALVGGQFKTHQSGTFKAKVVNSEHPVTKNYQSFESWDETYVLNKFNPDIVILEERVDSIRAEPWTWIRKQGKGRVFYTASGHDHRTWSNPGFHDLLLRGILWTVGNDVNRSLEGLKFSEHRYQASDNIANYEKRDQPLMLQEPFEQIESQKFIQVPPEFDLQIFATEPDIINPIFISWDEKGRLWVIETVDYPNQVRKSGIGNDRIKICEDTDGDGRADKFTIFADGLNIPTSLAFSNGGVIVSAAPNFFFLKDTDGDDIADEKEILISGWGDYDTHAGPSNLKYGFDNYIWGTVGYSAFEGVVAGATHKFRQGIYRFNPEVTDFEFVTSTSNNTWGLGFSETFDVFASTANNAHSWYLGIPDRYFHGITGIPAVGSKKIAGYYAFHPITQNIRQVDVFGGFTAAAGHNLYTARAFPRRYWNQMALISEPTGNLLAQGWLTKDGAGFVLEDRWNLLASSDEWVSPVHAEVGPDGAVWVADWYNFIIQHNPTPTIERGGYQAETGKGNAHVNPLRDKSYGRIYRIVSKNAPNYQAPALTPEKPESLVNTLVNENLFWRLTAQRLLVERGKSDVLPQLIDLVKNTAVDEIGINPGAIHALWTMHGLGALNGINEDVNKVVSMALYHPSPGVRKAAIQVIPATDWAIREILKSEILDDNDPHTLLAALLRISEFPSDQELGKSLYEISKSDRLVKDLWLSQALFVAAKSHYSGFSSAYNADQSANDYHIEPEKKQEELPSVWDVWDNPRQVTADWPEYSSGTAWEESILPDFNGHVVAYKEVNLKSIPEDAMLSLGRIGQSDRAFVNGTMLHETPNDPQKLRKYEVPVDKLNVGLNYIIVTIDDDKGPGGFLGPNEEMYLETADETLQISGAWKYFIREKKSRGINQSGFDATDQLGAIFMAYNTGTPYSGETVEPVGLDENVVRVKLKAVRNQMKYDQDQLVVPAGQVVQIEFENSDLMQHNLLIIVPGSLEVVGAAADALAQLPNGQDKHYVPGIPQVLYASALVNPGESVILQFTTPSEPGDYPFVCTFPGHWQTMNGILKVEGAAN